MGLDKVIAVMQQLGKKPKLGNFEDKLVVQKSICLLDLMGFKTGYEFSMYIRGPYSPDLTKDLYVNKGDFEGLKTTYIISKKQIQMIEKLQELSNNLDPTLLEIMATYAFLRKKMELGNKEALIRLKKLKPSFSEVKIAIGVSRAKELFPPSKKEIQEIREEFADWESAAIADFKY